MSADLPVPKFVYGGAELVMTLPSSLVNIGLSRLGGDIDADSGMRATYVIRDDDSRVFALRFWEDEYPAVQALLDAGIDGTIIEYFPDSESLVSYFIIIDSPSAGTTYYPTPDPQYARVFTIPISFTALSPSAFDDEVIPETGLVDLPWIPQFVVDGTRFAFTYPVTRWIPGERTVGTTAKDTLGLPGASITFRRYLLGLQLRFLVNQWSMVRDFITQVQRVQSFTWELHGIYGTPESLVVRLESPRIPDHIAPTRDSAYPSMLLLPIVLSSADPFALLYFPPEIPLPPPPLPDPVSGPPLSRVGWTMSKSAVGGFNEVAILDLNPNTVGSFGRATVPGDWFQLDMHALTSVGSIHFYLPFSGMPTDGVILGSVDGVDWTVMYTWSVPAVYQENHTFSWWPPYVVRYVRIQTSVAAGDWSIGDLNMYAEIP